jgi:hypothetical protein
MTLRIKTVLVMLVALLLAVPTGAMAKPGNKGDKDNGKPAWAGKGHDKADKAKANGKLKAAHEKKAKKEKQKAKFGAADEEAEDESDPDELSLEDLEALEAIHAPGQYCHALEAFQDSLAGMWGGDSFDERFGENANLSNSHGKCASWRAHGGSLEEDAAQEEQSAEEEASEEEGEGSEEPAEDACEPAEDEDAAEESSEEAAAEESSDEDAGEDCDAEEPSENEEQSEEEEESADEESAEGGSFMSDFDLARLSF